MATVIRFDVVNGITMQLYVILVLSLNLGCWASRYPYNERRGRYYCPPTYDPRCASNGVHYVYFENQCHLDVRNYQEKRLGQQEYVVCPVDRCYPKCKTCPDTDDPVCVVDGRTQQLREFKNPCEVEFVACSFKKYYRFLNYGSCPKQYDCSSFKCSQDYRPICVNTKSLHREFSNDCEFQRSLCQNNLNWKTVQPGPCSASRTQDYESREEFLEPVCAAYGKENRTFQSYYQLQKEIEKTGKYWSVLYPGYCENRRSCRGEIIKPICAKLNNTILKNFLSPCHLQAEKAETGQNWVILYQGLCRTSTMDYNTSTQEAGSSGLVTETSEPEYTTSTDQSVSSTMTVHENGNETATQTPTDTTESQRSVSDNIETTLEETEGTTEPTATIKSLSDGNNGNKTEAVTETPTDTTEDQSSDSDNIETILQETEETTKSTATNTSLRDGNTGNKTETVTEVPTNTTENQSSDSDNIEATLEETTQPTTTDTSLSDGNNGNATETSENLLDNQNSSITNTTNSNTNFEFGILSDAVHPDDEMDQTNESASESEPNESSTQADGTDEDVTSKSTNQNGDPSEIPINIGGFVMFVENPATSPLSQNTTGDQVTGMDAAKEEVEEANQKQEQVTEPVPITPKSDIEITNETNQTTEPEPKLDRNDRNNEIIDNDTPWPSLGRKEKLNLALVILKELGIFDNPWNPNSSSNPDENKGPHQGNDKANSNSSDPKEGNGTQDEGSIHDVQSSTGNSSDSEVSRATDSIPLEEATTEISSTLETPGNNDISNQRENDGSVSENPGSSGNDNENINPITELTVENPVTPSNQSENPALSMQNLTDSESDGENTTPLNTSHVDENSKTTVVPEIPDSPGARNGSTSSPSGLNDSLNPDNELELADTPEAATPSQITTREEQLNSALAMLEELGFLSDFVNRNNSTNPQIPKGNNEPAEQEIESDDLNSPALMNNNGTQANSGGNDGSVDSLNNVTPATSSDSESSNSTESVGNSGTATIVGNENSTPESTETDTTASTDVEFTNLDDSEITETTVGEDGNSDATTMESSGNNSANIDGTTDPTTSTITLSQETNNSSLISSESSANNSRSSQVSETESPSLLDVVTETSVRSVDETTANLENSEPVLDVGFLSDAVNPDNNSSSTSSQRADDVTLNVTRTAASRTISVQTVSNSPLVDNRRSMSFQTARRRNNNSLHNRRNSTHSVTYNGAVYTAPSSYSPTYNFITLPSGNVLYSSLPSGSNYSYPIDSRVLSHLPIPPSPPSYTGYAQPKNQYTPPVNSYQHPKPNVQIAPSHETVVPYYSSPEYPVADNYYTETQLSGSTYDGHTEEVYYTNHRQLPYNPEHQLYAGISSDYNSPVHQPSVSASSSIASLANPHHIDPGYTYDFDNDDDYRILGL